MTQVIINDILPFTQAIAIGGQTVYSTNWTADSADDVVVYSRASSDAPDDATQILAPSLYNVAFIGALLTVQVTLINPSTAGDVITITRSTPVSRENLYTNTNFTPSMLNQDFGLVTLQIQENDLSEQQLTPRYPKTALLNPWDLILPQLAAGESWIMNASGNQIIAEVISGGGGGDVTLAMLASHSPGEGASLIGLNPTGTVQDLANAPFILKTPNTAAPNAQVLSALTTGILKSTTGTGVLSISAPLTSIDGLTTAVDEMLYLTGPNTYAVTPFTTAGRTLVGEATTANMLSFLGALPLAGGTMTGAINMGGFGITNMLDGVNPQDAATINNVTLNNSNFLPLAGGTMSGVINMGNHKITNLTDPTNPQDAVTKFYIDDQLTNYLPLSGGTMQGAINMNSHKITGVTDPTNSQDAATKAYVDLVATGLTVQAACYATTTANLNAIYVNGASGIGATLTNNGALAAFSTDGTSPPTNARILVKDQTSKLQNGIYTLTNQGSGAVAWILTRATDYDQPAEITPGDLVVVQNGTLYATTSFIQTDTVTAVGTDPIEFTQFTFAPTSFLLKANNLSDVANKTTSFNNVSPLTTKGDLIGFDSTNNVRLAVGGTNGQILQVNSAAATGLAWSTATYPDRKSVV